MRAARLIKMVLLLQSRPLMTAAQLARELQVSERTITRDAQALSEAGVPVYADRGRSGGYRLVGGYRTGLTGLAQPEAEALFLSGLPGALREMGLADAASAARLKVSAALMPSLRDTPDSVARRFHLDAPGWYREPQTPELLPLLAEAVWSDRLVSAVYRRREDEPPGGAARELAPYGLVLKAGVWYLCAAVAAAAGTGTTANGTTAAELSTAPKTLKPPKVPKAPKPLETPTTAPAETAAGTTRKDGEAFPTHRVYRVDRFVSAELLEERFRRDESFELGTFWEERAAEFARSLLRYEVTVRLTPKGALQLPHVTDGAAAKECLATASAPDGESRITARLAMESEDVAYGQLLALGPEAEVLAPLPLRARFAEAARGLAGLYDA